MISLLGLLIVMDCFSLASMYKVISPPLLSHNNYNWIWEIPTLRKIRFFLWLCSHNRLPLNSFLHRLNIIPSSTCNICNHEEEDIYHIFFGCPIVLTFWSKFHITLPSFSEFLSEEFK